MNDANATTPTGAAADLALATAAADKAARLAWLATAAAADAARAVWHAAARAARLAADAAARADA